MPITVQVPIVERSMLPKLGFASTATIPTQACHEGLHVWSVSGCLAAEGELTRTEFLRLCGMIRQLTREQTIPADVASVWAFFATPANLNALTPPSLHFQILQEPAPMYAGQMISYRIRVAPFIRLRWLTEIVQVQPPRYFVDEQRIGPYRLWHHEHHFTEAAGGTQMVDRVTYALPLGVIGDVVHAVWVQHQLQYIFDYRAAKVREAFLV